MKRFIRMFITLMVLSASALSLVPTSAAEPVPDVVIQVGAEHPDDPNKPFMYTRYYPDHVKVHRGDLVKWEWGAGSYGGWHSITFLKEDMDVATFPTGLETAHHPPGRLDEVPGTIALNELWVTGYDRGGPAGNGRDSGGTPHCGRGDWLDVPAEEPCRINSTDRDWSSSLSDMFFNTGSGQKASFLAYIDLPVGVYRYHCNMHPGLRNHPDLGDTHGMQGQIEVVADSEPLPTAEEIALQRNRDIQQDTAEAEEIFNRASDPEKGEWTVKVQERSASSHVTLMSFFPGHLNIRRGEKVRFVVSGDDPSTVTFPREVGGSLNYPHGCGPSRCGPSLNSSLRCLPPSCSPDPSGAGVPVGAVLLLFPWGCELDHPSEPESAPATLAGWQSPSRGCAKGDLEWGWGPNADPRPAPGNAIVSKATYHDSGFMSDRHFPDWWRKVEGWSRSELPYEFEASFPVAGDFTYVCSYHPEFMVGSIRVN